MPGDPFASFFWHGAVLSAGLYPFVGRAGNGKIITYRSAMSTEAADSRSVDARAICLFYGVAFGLNWLLALPLWFSGEGLHTPLALWLLPLMMLTPAIGVVAVWVFLPHRFNQSSR